MSDEAKRAEQEPEPEREPRIIVDEDWKEQVAREKQVASDPAVESAPESGAGESAAAADSTPPSHVEAEASARARVDASRSGASGSSMPVPPANFEFLVSMLFTQAMSFLGQIPEPGTGETHVDKPMAKHSIDTLELLSEKTRGNLSEEEAKMLSEALHALRMTFVNVKG